MLRNKKLSIIKTRSSSRRTRRASLVAILSRNPRLEMLESRALLAAHPLTSIPVLNSNPSASAALYLDFNGHFEATWGSNSNITTPVFDKDGDSSTYSDDELAFMTDVWKIVAEDYAPFKINVTTVEPAVLAPGVPASQANGVALRVAIGGTGATSGISGAGSGGVAYLNSFTSATSNVAYAFSDNSAIVVGLVASHEAGHSFGLSHQSNSYDAVARTQGIMVGFSSFEDATWSLGTNQYNNIQDDMAILANSLNGFGYRADDFGGSISNTTPLINDNGTLTVNGIIGSTSDVDMFSFITPGANGVKIDVQGSVIGQNLDIAFDFLDAAGNVLATANPTDSLDATLILPSTGARYLAVRSTGAYGRVGQYAVSVSAAIPGVEVVAGTSNLVTNEKGLSDSFTVRLTSKPAANVTINMSSSDESEGIVSPGQIIFTADNWHLPQTVVVTGVDDFSVDGIIAYSINFVSVVSVDTNYAGMTIASLQASNVDNDVPGSAVQLGGSQADVKIDQQGNLVVTGTFSVPTDFDPGPGVKLLTPGSARDGYIAKYSPTYELIWAKSFVATSSLTYSYSLDFDTVGNVYVAGATNSASTTFGNTVLTNQGSSDAFLTKLDANGNFLWARGWGGLESDEARQVRIGSNGNIIVAGSYRGTIDANPGSGTFTLTSAGMADSYVSHFTPDGIFISSATLGGADTDFIRQLEVDDAGNIYAAGYFFGTSNLGGQTLTSAGSFDQFLIKMNPSGSVQWARQVAGIGSGALVAGLATDGSGSVYLAAAFTGVINFGPGTPTLTSTGTRSSYVAKWDSSGTLQRADQLSGDALVSILGLAIGANGNLNLFGTLQGTADFDPGPGDATRTSIGVQDSIILRLDSDYQFLDLVQIGRATGNIAALDVDAQGNLIVAGAFGNGGPVRLPTGDVFDGANGAGYGYLLRLNLAAGVTVGPTVGLVTSEDGTSTSFNVVLDIPPTADVTIPVSSSNSSEGVVSTSFLTFTPTNWNVPQTVVVTGVNDTVIDGDKSYSIFLGPATSADPTYNGYRGNDVRVTNTDNDLASTKFYVVDDASANRTFEYGANGSAVENYSLNSGNSAPRGAASTAAGDKVWVVDANKRVYVYNNDGVLLGSWSAGSLASNATIEGITTNGTDVWLVDARQDRVYRYAAAASRLSGSQNATSNFALNNGNVSPKDLVTDGAHIWVVNDSTTDRVFKYSMTGALVGSWTIDSANKAPTGITIDPSGATQSIWIVDNGTDRVYEYTDSRSRNSGSQSTLISFALAAGNTNPQGIADPPVNSIHASTTVATTSVASVEAPSDQMLSEPTYPQGQVVFASRSFAVGSVSNDNALTTSKVLNSQPTTLIQEKGPLMTTFVAPTPRQSTSKSSSVSARDEAFSSVDLLQDEDLLDLLTTSVKSLLNRRRM